MSSDSDNHDMWNFKPMYTIQPVISTREKQMKGITTINTTITINTNTTIINSMERYNTTVC